MNRLQFGEGGCEKTRKYLDSYISNELLVETNHEVLKHIEGCAACAGELEAGTRLRGRVKAAVRAQSVPPELQVRIREQIRSSGSGPWWAGWRWAGSPQWAAVAVALLVTVTGVTWNYTREKMPALSDRPGQYSYIQRISATMAGVMKVGLGDHIHCSIFRKYPRDPQPVEKMEADLGPSYKGLLPVVRKAAPAGYRVIMAHQCGFAGRKYIHLTLENRGDLLSIVISRRKEGESMQGLPPVSDSAGMAIYQSAAGRYQVAGFEAGDFLAYVVSDLKSKANLQIAVNVAPEVREFLSKVTA
jgi:anti-sigma factor RsiW